MKYINLTEENINIVVNKYVEYYNNDGGIWTYDKAYKRIHQVMATEDSLSLIMLDDNENYLGFLMGYYKEFDDLKAYYLEEIVIFNPYQNKGYGSKLLNKLEEIVTKSGAEHIELLSLNDDMHSHFYSKNGFYESKNIVLMGKHYK